jgi:hypothetical protein
MMEGHEERAEELEYELADMQEESDSLADDIHSAKADWEQKKQDDSVPGARGEAGDEPPGEAVGEDDEGPDPETTGGGPGGGGTPEVED